MADSFSPCGRYRYRLDRTIDMFGGLTIGFCLHNPSTADEVQDDPTSRRGIGFARSWGASRLVFVNPWAGIATKPNALWAMDDPIGPENDAFIEEAAREIARSGGYMIAAWGAVSPPAAMRDKALSRLAFVTSLIRAQACELRTLGLNANGSPKHPLYIAKKTRPELWL